MRNTFIYFFILLIGLNSFANDNHKDQMQKFQLAYNDCVTNNPNNAHLLLCLNNLYSLKLKPYFNLKTNEILIKTQTAPASPDQSAMVVLITFIRENNNRDIQTCYVKQPDPNSSASQDLTTADCLVRKLLKSISSLPI